MLLAETARTLLRKLLPFPGLGLGTTFQELPVQCSMRVWNGPPAESSPTAQTLRVESTATPNRSSLSIAGFRGFVPAQVLHGDAALAAAAVPGLASAPASASGVASAR